VKRLFLSRLFSRYCCPTVRSLRLPSGMATSSSQQAWRRPQLTFLPSMLLHATCAFAC